MKTENKKMDHFTRLKFSSYLIEKELKTRKECLEYIANEMEKYIDWTPTKDDIIINERENMIIFIKNKQRAKIYKLYQARDCLCRVGFMGESNEKAQKVLVNFCREYKLDGGGKCYYNKNNIYKNC